MFTGIVEELGRLAKVEPAGDGVRVSIQGPLVAADAKLGDSICVSGVCLTVTELLSDGFAADVMKQTLSLTTLGSKAPGDFVNLERALQAQSRLGGHIVQGHVDTSVRLLQRTPGAQWDVLRFELPAAFAKYVALRGSICVDGVSLTVSDLGEDFFEVSLIPATMEHTTLGGLEAGSAVNLEIDILARHLEQLMKERNV